MNHLQGPDAHRAQSAVKAAPYDPNARSQTHHVGVGRSYLSLVSCYKRHLVRKEDGVEALAVSRLSSGRPPRREGCYPSHRSGPAAIPFRVRFDSLSRTVGACPRAAR